ncbi:MAG: TonB-dependent receptor [Ignavibacteriaceae bacterium]|nr:TonB-dependent receptor [Ignavibacteriaceae bacterium]
MVKINFIIFFAVFLLPVFIFAQKDIVQKTDTAGFYRLTDVVVSATKTPSNTFEVANSISIVDSSEIVNKNVFNTFDVLKNEYGLSFSQQGNKSGVSNVFIRGGNSSHTLVLIDGVEVNLPNDPSNFYNFFALPNDNISRIEVLRGPQSTLYGSDALAGVINIITTKGTGKPAFNISAEGGSYNTFKGTASSLGAIGKLNYSIALSRIKSDGFSSASVKYVNKEKDGYQIDNISSLLGYDFAENFKTNFVIRFNKSRSDLDQSDGLPEHWDDPTYIFNQEEFFLRGQGELNLLDNKWNQKFGLTFFRNVRKYSYDTSAVSIFYPEYIYDYSWSIYDGRKYKLDWQNNYKLNESNLVTLGSEFDIEESSSEYYGRNYIPDPIYPDITSIFPTKSANIFSIYFQDQIKLDDSFFGTIGIRYDNHNQFGSVFTYRFAPAYIFWKTGTKLKATLGSGFKSPSLFDLYDPFYGNPELNPEKSFGWDAGIEQFFWKEGVSVGVTYFNNNYKNMFGFEPITYKTININKAETNGVEVFIKAGLIHGLDIKTNYTYTNARDKSENTPDYNKKLVRRPEHKAGLFVSYSFNDVTNANVEFIYVGTREEPDFINYPSRIIMPDYFLINLAAHYDLFSFLRLKIRIENLLDKQYEDVYGYGTAGFSVYGGISLGIE